MPRDSDAKNKRGAHTSSLSFRIQVLRQKIHQLEWSPAVDHLVDQIALTARQLLDHALRRGPDGFVCPMDTCRKEQHQRGVSQIHGKPRENSHRSVPTLVFSVPALQQNDVEQYPYSDCGTKGHEPKGRVRVGREWGFKGKSPIRKG